MQHILASLDDKGCAGVVLDTGACYRTEPLYKKERDIRKWFIENDLIEGVIYLPANIFYNTTTHGVIIFLNKNKEKNKKDKLLLINASVNFKKGDPKNFLSEKDIKLISDTYINWKEVQNFSVIINNEVIATRDYNISPNRYITSLTTNQYESISDLTKTIKELKKQEKNILKKLKDII